MESRIPKEYRVEILRARLPNPRAFDEVQGWCDRGWDSGDYMDFDSYLMTRGIIAAGGTGQGKTRAVAQLAFTCFTANSWSHSDDHVFLFLPATALKRAAPISAGRPGTDKHDRAEAEKLIEEARSCDLLLLDDLSQPKFTPAYAEVLYDIVEHRTSHRLPNFVTLQLGRDEFLEKVSDNNPHLLSAAEAIFRRLTDYCDVIDFDHDPQGTYDHAKWLADWIAREGWNEV